MGITICDRSKNLFGIRDIAWYGRGCDEYFLDIKTLCCYGWAGRPFNKVFKSKSIERLYTDFEEYLKGFGGYIINTRFININPKTGEEIEQVDRNEL